MRNVLQRASAGAPQYTMIIKSEIDPILLKTHLLVAYDGLMQGSTLAMCPLARMHFLGRRASSGHNNLFYAGPRGQWLSDRWQTHVAMYQFFMLTYRVSPCDGLTYKYFHPQSYSTCTY